MRLEARKDLEDVRRAAVRILSFAEDKSLQDYLEDDLLQSGVERQFEIIGEAVNRLSRADPDVVCHITEFQRIISFRNILIHGYDAVENEVVWGLVRGRLPALLAEVEALLAEP